MANVARPPLRGSSDDGHLHVGTARALSNNNNLSTRLSSSRGSPRLALGDDEGQRPTKQFKHSPISRTRPLPKIAVTQPQVPVKVPTTNGVAVSAPQPVDAADKRSLRSHDGGSRLKSDLQVYFASYEDIIAGVPTKPEFLDLDTPIYILDEPTRASISPSRSRKRKASSPAPSSPSTSTCIPPAQSSTSYQVLDYSSLSKALRHDAAHDPLADTVFFAQHRRAERKEKQLRNIEKERAMHEKVQLERLLDGLQGPDWLKVMGITGVTDGERKDWEPKRTYFVSEVAALVDKFRVWKEEEKRLRAEKEALAAREEASTSEEPASENEDSDIIMVNGRSPRPSPRPRSTHAPSATTKPVPRRPPRPHGFLLPYILPEPTAPFQSFYAKPHLRAAALGKHRHGRGAMAFGHAIPDFEEHEFELPDDFVDPQFLKDNARQRRRRKRESAVDKESVSVSVVGNASASAG